MDKIGYIVRETIVFLAVVFALMVMGAALALLAAVAVYYPTHWEWGTPMGEIYVWCLSIVWGIMIVKIAWIIPTTIEEWNK